MIPGSRKEPWENSRWRNAKQKKNNPRNPEHILPLKNMSPALSINYWRSYSLATIPVHRKIGIGQDTWRIFKTSYENQQEEPNGFQLLIIERRSGTWQHILWLVSWDYGSQNTFETMTGDVIETFKNTKLASQTEKSTCQCLILKNLICQSCLFTFKNFAQSKTRKLTSTCQKEANFDRL